MNLPPWTLRVIFSASMLCTSFWVIGLAWDAVFGDNNVVVAALALALTGAIAWLFFRDGRMALKGPIAASDLLESFVPRLGGAYLALAVVVGSATFLVIKFAGLDQRSGDAEFAALLLGLWLALWAAPGLAALWVWRRVHDS